MEPSSVFYPNVDPVWHPPQNDEAIVTDCNDDTQTIKLWLWSQFWNEEQQAKFGITVQEPHTIVTCHPESGLCYGVVYLVDPTSRGTRTNLTALKERLSSKFRSTLDLKDIILTSHPDLGHQSLSLVWWRVKDRKRPREEGNDEQSPKRIPVRPETQEFLEGVKKENEKAIKEWRESTTRPNPCTSVTQAMRMWWDYAPKRIKSWAPILALSERTARCMLEVGLVSREVEALGKIILQSQVFCGERTPLGISPKVIVPVDTSKDIKVTISGLVEINLQQWQDMEQVCSDYCESVFESWNIQVKLKGVIPLCTITLRRRPRSP